MKRFASAIVIGLALSLTGCGWLQSGYDAGHSNGNEWENHITGANVAQLVDHAIPSPDPAHSIDSYITVNNHLLISSGANVYAYSTTTCPTADGSPCTPLWQAPGGPTMAADGQRVFIEHSGTDVRNLGGELLWHTSIDGSHLTISGGFVYATVGQVQVCNPPICGHVVYRISHDLWRFRADCEPAQCPAEPLGVWDPSRILTSLDPGEAAGPAVSVFDGIAHYDRIRHGILINEGGAYDLDDPACQAARPTCTPLATYSGLTDTAAISPHHVFNEQRISATTKLVWYPGVETPCPGAPATCTPEATAPLTQFSGSVSVGGEVVYAGSATGLDAFAEDGTTNCTGAVPRTCSPIAQFNLGGATAGEIQVVDRRVYIATSDRVLHVLSLPGDIS